MLFKLNTAEHLYNEDQKVKLEKLGFSFEPIDEDSSFKDIYKYQKPTNDEGIFEDIEIHIDTLEDLLKLCDLSGDGKIIVQRDKIIIYDDYVE